jgi:uncharacterized membrane protein YbhN (UPF0104 family)
MSEAIVAEVELCQYRVAGRLLGLVVTVVVLAAWGWFLYGQISVLNLHSWQITPFWLVIAVLLAMLYFVGLGICWTLLLRSMSALPNPISIFQGARIWQMSMFTRYIPGNIWHVLSRALLAEQVRASRSLVIASATVEQLLSVLGALLVVSLALPRLGMQVVGATSLPVSLIIPIALVAGLVVVHPRILGRLFNWVGTRLQRPEIAWRYDYRIMIGLLSLYAATTVVTGLSLAAIVIGMGSLEIANIPFIVGSAALAWAVGYVSIVTPSGLGVREGVLAGLLALVVPLPVAIVASLLFRLVSMGGESLALVVFWLAGSRRFSSS